MRMMRHKAGERRVAKEAVRYQDLMVTSKVGMSGRVGSREAA